MKQVFEYVSSFVAIALILAGLGGLAYHMFKEGGWLGAVLGKIWDVNMENPVIAIPVTLGILFIGKLWFDHTRAKGHTSKLPNVLIYIIMLAGVFFIYQFISHGMSI